MQRIIHDLTYMPKGHTGHLCPTKDVVDAWQKFYNLYKFTNLLEFGFNTGWGSALLLTMFPSINVTSIEIEKTDRSSQGAKILKQKFLGRHEIIWGDSEIVGKEVMKGLKKLPMKNYDFAFIDGDHSARMVEKDLKFCLFLGIKHFVFDDAQIPEINNLLKGNNQIKLVAEERYRITKWRGGLGYRFYDNHRIKLAYYQSI